VKPLVAHFATGDSGIINCTNPNNQKGSQPDGHMVSGGFESHVVHGMLLDRNGVDATTAATNIRHRYDGRNRSPWNEPECGQLYSRSMAHWNMIDHACGHCYDSITALSFDPRFTVPVSGGQRMFKCAYFVEGGWGQYSQQGPVGLPSGKLTLSCIWGAGVELKTLDVVSSAKTATATVGGNTQPASIAAGVITFSGAGLKLAKGQSLSVTLGGGDCELSMPTCDGTLRQRHSAWTGTSREDEEQGLAQTSCGPNDVEVVAQQRLLSEQLSGVAMVAGALLMFLLGSLLGPRIQALLELVFRQSTAYM
jgi:hypothetical protein